MITIAVPQAPADRAPRLAARRELRAAEVPAASARLELERAGGSRSPCRRRLRIVPRACLGSEPAITTAVPPSRPPPVRSALMRDGR